MLSQRLQSLHQQLGEGEVVWDIGCDHGQLGLSFLNSEQVEEIRLVDPSVRVIEALKQKLIDSYITMPLKISILQNYGQSIQIPSSKKNTIYIAGMGGKEIIEIIQALQNQINPQDRIIISPHRKVLELRKFLSQGPLKLITEMTVFENNQFYQILSLSLSATEPVHPYGTQIWEGDIGKIYKDHILKEFKGHRNELSRGLVAYLEGGGL